MNNNANQQQQITPAQAFQLLTEVAALPLLKLSLQEHSVVQQALQVLKPLVEEAANPELTQPENPSTT